MRLVRLQRVLSEWAFSGGDYAEVGRWLANFVSSHAKREQPRIEARVDTEGDREGRSYGVRLRLDARTLPARDEPPFDLAYPDVTQSSRESRVVRRSRRPRPGARPPLSAGAERGARTSA